MATIVAADFPPRKATILGTPVELVYSGINDEILTKLGLEGVSPEDKQKIMKDFYVTPPDSTAVLSLDAYPNIRAIVKPLLIDLIHKQQPAIKINKEAAVRDTSIPVAYHKKARGISLSIQLPPYLVNHTSGLTVEAKKIRNGIKNGMIQVNQDASIHQQQQEKMDNTIELKSRPSSKRKNLEKEEKVAAIASLVVNATNDDDRKYDHDPSTENANKVANMVHAFMKANAANFEIASINAKIKVLQLMLKQMTTRINDTKPFMMHISATQNTSKGPVIDRNSAKNAFSEPLRYDFDIITKYELDTLRDIITILEPDSKKRDATLRKIVDTFTSREKKIQGLEKERQDTILRKEKSLREAKQHEETLEKKYRQPKEIEKQEKELEKLKKGFPITFHFLIKLDILIDIIRTYLQNIQSDKPYDDSEIDKVCVMISSMFSANVSSTLPHAFMSQLHYIEDRYKGHYEEMQQINEEQNKVLTLLLSESKLSIIIEQIKQSRAENAVSFFSILSGYFRRGKIISIIENRADLHKRIYEQTVKVATSNMNCAEAAAQYILFHKMVNKMGMYLRDNNVIAYEVKPFDPSKVICKIADTDTIFEKVEKVAMIVEQAVRNGSISSTDANLIKPAIKAAVEVVVEAEKSIIESEEKKQIGVAIASTLARNRMVAKPLEMLPEKPIDVPRRVPEIEAILTSIMSNMSMNLNNSRSLKRVHDYILAQFNNIDGLLANESSATKLYYEKQMIGIFTILRTKYDKAGIILSQFDPLYQFIKRIDEKIDDNEGKIKRRMNEINAILIRLGTTIKQSNNLEQLILFHDEILHEFDNIKELMESLPDDIQEDCKHAMREIDALFITTYKKLIDTILLTFDSTIHEIDRKNQNNKTKLQEFDTLRGTIIRDFKIINSLLESNETSDYKGRMRAILILFISKYEKAGGKLSEDDPIVRLEKSLDQSPPPIDLSDLAIRTAIAARFMEDISLENDENNDENNDEIPDPPPLPSNDNNVPPPPAEPYPFNTKNEEAISVAVTTSMLEEAARKAAEEKIKAAEAAAVEARAIAEQAAKEAADAAAAHASRLEQERLQEAAKIAAEAAAAKEQELIRIKKEQANEEQRMVAIASVVQEAEKTRLAEEAEQFRLAEEAKAAAAKAAEEAAKAAEEATKAAEEATKAAEEAAARLAEEQRLLEAAKAEADAAAIAEAQAREAAAARELKIAELAKKAAEEEEKRAAEELIRIKKEQAEEEQRMVAIASLVQEALLEKEAEIARLAEEARRAEEAAEQAEQARIEAEERETKARTKQAKRLAKQEVREARLKEKEAKRKAAELAEQERVARERLEEEEKRKQEQAEEEQRMVAIASLVEEKIRLAEQERVEEEHKRQEEAAELDRVARLAQQHLEEEQARLQQAKNEQEAAELAERVRVAELAVEDATRKALEAEEERKQEQLAVAIASVVEDNHLADVKKAEEEAEQARLRAEAAAAEKARIEKELAEAAEAEAKAAEAAEAEAKAAAEAAKAAKDLEESRKQEQLSVAIASTVEDNHVTEQVRQKVAEEERLRAAEEERIRVAEEERIRAAEEERLRAAEVERIRAAEEVERLRVEAEQAQQKAAQAEAEQIAKETRLAEEKLKEEQLIAAIASTVEHGRLEKEAAIKAAEEAEAEAEAARRTAEEAAAKAEEAIRIEMKAKEEKQKKNILRQLAKNVATAVEAKRKAEEEAVAKAEIAKEAQHSLNNSTFNSFPSLFNQPETIEVDASALSEKDSSQEVVLPESQPITPQRAKELKWQATVNQIQRNKNAQVQQKKNNNQKERERIIQERQRLAEEPVQEIVPESSPESSPVATEEAARVAAQEEVQEKATATIIQLIEKGKQLEAKLAEVVKQADAVRQAAEKNTQSQENAQKKANKIRNELRNELEFYLEDSPQWIAAQQELKKLEETNKQRQNKANINFLQNELKLSRYGPQEATVQKELNKKKANYKKSYGIKLGGRKTRHHRHKRRNRTRR